MLEVLYGVPPACVYISINLNCSDKSMKITNFSLIIEVSKEDNGCSNNYYVDIDEKWVSVSHPYIKQIPEQVTLVHNLINTFIANAINFNSRVNVFNKEMGLEEYAVVTPPQVKTTGSDFDLDAKPAVSQVAGGGSDTTDLVAHSEQEQERLDMEELEARETSSDNA